MSDLTHLLHRIIRRRALWISFMNHEVMISKFPLPPGPREEVYWWTKPSADGIRSRLPSFCKFSDFLLLCFNQFPVAAFHCVPIPPLIPNFMQALGS